METVENIALPLVQDVAKTIRYDIDYNSCKDVWHWTNERSNSYVGRKYDFGEILKIGLDDWKGVRIKFKFYFDNTIRNISVNVFTEQFWIGEPIDY